MVTISVHAAKTYFSQLLDRVVQGEEMVIPKAGKAVTRLVPVKPAAGPRRPGSARGLGRVGDNLDAPMVDEFVAACAKAPLPTSRIAP